MLVKGVTNTVQALRVRSLALLKPHFPQPNFSQYIVYDQYEFWMAASLH